MAKAQTTSAAHNARTPFTTVIPYSSVFWIRELNFARPTRQYGKIDDLIESMTEKGWLMSPDGIITAEPASPDRKKQAEDELARRWEAMKELARTDSSQLIRLATFNEIWTVDGLGTKLKPVEYIGVSGNRRSEAYFEAMVNRKQANLPLSLEIPVCIRTFSSPLERLAAQLGENLDKTLGFRPPSDVDNLLAAKTAVELGANQAELRRVFKDGTGQKLWGLLSLDSRFPDLRIVERFRLEATDPQYLRLSAFSNKHLPDLVLRSDPKALKAKNESLALQGKEQLAPTTQEEVAKFLTETSNGGASTDGAPEKKVMKGEAIRGIAEKFPNRALRAMADAIAKNDVDGLRLYQSNSTVFNCLDDLVREGDGPSVELILARINSLKNGERAALIQSLIAVIDGTDNA